MVHPPSLTEALPVIPIISLVNFELPCLLGRPVCMHCAIFLHRFFKIIIQLKTEYLLHSIISRIRKRKFINSFDVSKILG